MRQFAAHEMERVVPASLEDLANSDVKRLEGTQQEAGLVNAEDGRGNHRGAWGWSLPPSPLTATPCFPQACTLQGHAPCSLPLPYTVPSLPSQGHSMPLF